MTAAPSLSHGWRRAHATPAAATARRAIRSLARMRSPRRTSTRSNPAGVVLFGLATEPSRRHFRTALTEYPACWAASP